MDNTIPYKRTKETGEMFWFSLQRGGEVKVNPMNTHRRFFFVLIASSNRLYRDCGGCQFFFLPKTWTPRSSPQGQPDRGHPEKAPPSVVAIFGLGRAGGPARAFQSTTDRLYSRILTS